MATYKVLQDIEAEDKFVGPLTLKQFILAGITFVCLYISFILLSKHLWILAIPFVPIILASGFLAFPWGRDQPTEIWLLAKIRFMLKPRRRIWDQTGMQELVTITAPKHVEQYVSDNLSQTEVKSRLKALADTIDSRGWAVKNASVNLFNQPAYGAASEESDRLIDLSAFAHEIPNVDIHAADDILDEQNNPTAQHLSQMIDNSSQAHRQATLQNLKDVSSAKVGRRQTNNKSTPNDGPPQDFWFMHQPDPVKTPAGYATFENTQTVAPGTYDEPITGSGQQLTPAEESLLSQLRRRGDSQSTAYGHTRVIEPIGSKHRSKHSDGGKNAERRTNNRENTTSPKTLNPAILELANNDDLTVATIARQVGKRPKPEPPSNEVVVPLR